MTDQDFKNLAKDVTEIKDALLGTNYNKGQGIVYQVCNHEKRISRLEKTWIWITGAATATGIIIGILIKIILK